MRKKEIIIFAALLVIAAAALLIMSLSNADSDKYVRITVDGNEYKSIPLNESTNTTFTIHTDEGVNHVVISDGHVDVVSADCPTQICVTTKPASSISDMIVCLPHKVVIEIVGSNNEVK